MGFLTPAILQAGTKLGELGIMGSVEDNTQNDHLGNTALSEVFNNDNVNHIKAKNSGYLFYIIAVVGIFALVYILRR